MNDIIENIKNRRSIRKYKDKAIPKNLIEEIIEAGRYAPSSHNSQPWRFIVVTNKNKIKEISDYVKSWFKKRLKFGYIIGLFNKKIKEELASAKNRLDTGKDLFFYDAPLLVLVCAKKGRFTEKDCSCAAENMLLAARSLAIGSCWIGFADLALSRSRSLLYSLGVTKGHELMATLVFGYAEKFPEKAFPRKEEANIIKWVS